MISSLKSYLPLFLVIALSILVNGDIYSDQLIGDEGKFYQHAENITEGFYTDRANPNFMEGPGYPLYLSVSAALDIPYFWTRASHIVLIFIAAIFFLKMLRFYIPVRAAWILTYLFVLYPPLNRWAHLMYAEALTILLLLGFLYYFIKAFRTVHSRSKNSIFAALFLGALALTKLIVPYVILVALLICLLLGVFPRTRSKIRSGLLLGILTGAMLVVAPYAIYCYQITGKVLYMGMHGGSILYFRSTPFENEFGNWFNEANVLKDVSPEARDKVMVNTDQLRENHGEFIAQIDSLSFMERDSLYKRQALINMREHPGKYLKNTVANVSRLFFHFPFSYRIQNMATLGYLIPNMFLVVLAFLGSYPAWKRRDAIPQDLWLLFGFSFIYIGGHILLGGRGRFLIPVVPIWMAFYAFVYLRILNINIRTKDVIDSQKPD